MNVAIYKPAIFEGWEIEEVAAAFSLLQALSVIVAVALAIAGYLRWRKERLQRVNLTTSVNFLGKKDDKVICEAVATIENTGITKLDIDYMKFKIRGLAASDKLTVGPSEIRHQVLLPDLVTTGDFVAYKKDEEGQLYPNTRAEYDFMTMIPDDLAYIRIEAEIKYQDSDDKHAVAKSFAVPTFEAVSASKLRE